MANSVQKVYGPPGTGKTTYLIDKEVGAALERGISPNKIAFLTFTNVAADAAAKRLAERHEKKKENFRYFSTLHKMATRLGGMKNLGIMEYEDRRKFDKNIGNLPEWIREGDILSIADRPKHPILDDWSLALNRREKFEIRSLGYPEYLESFYADEENIKETLEDISNIRKYAVKYIKDYIHFKEKMGVADFDDVLLNAIDEKAVGDKRFPDLDLLVVDEAQDLSNLQWDFVDRLAKKSERLVIAGDDDQAIMEAFGAEPSRFVKYQTTEEDVVLDVSHRVPVNIKEHVDNGIVSVLKAMFARRVEKIWRSSDKLSEGEVINGKELDNIITDYILPPKQKAPNEYNSEVSGSEKEEWLFLAPTNKTVGAISTALRDRNIPHFKKNQPIGEAEKGKTKIRVKTIHTAKGEEADNVAVVVQSPSDKSMWEEDPRLEYVAKTRAKKRLFLKNKGEIENG